MILGSLKRNHVTDDKLWEMVEQAHRLTMGGYDVWDDNGPVLVPLMERILARSKEKGEWQVYFYDMEMLFWLIRREAVNDIPKAFKLGEVFHRDIALGLGEGAGKSAQEWQVSMAADLLNFYLGYPQIDDGKIRHMLDLFLELHRRFGSSWNNGDYKKVLDLAFLDQDDALAELARRKLEKADYQSWCYVCYYGRAMIGYYVFHGDFEGAEEMVSRICTRGIPAKYQWCYNQCEGAEEGSLVEEALIGCLKMRKRELFEKAFAKWRRLFEEPEEGEVSDTHRVLFHSLAGDWSRLEDRLRLAEEDDRDRKKQKAAPLDCLYWSLCWHCYFRLLEKQGTVTVWMKLGEEEGPGGRPLATGGAEAENRPVAGYRPGERPAFRGAAQEGRQEWPCLQVAGYFEKQADLLGAQMDRARKRFQYKKVKKAYEECFLGGK